jgi:hypothetical protein
MEGAKGHMVQPTHGEGVLHGRGSWGNRHRVKKQLVVSGYRREIKIWPFIPSLTLDSALDTGVLALADWARIPSLELLRGRVSWHRASRESSPGLLVSAGLRGLQRSQ